MPYPVTRTCAAYGCAAQVSSKLLMCRRHWMMLPVKLRSAVWEAYRANQQDLSGPITRAYTTAVTKAQDWIAENEPEEDVA